MWNLIGWCTIGSLQGGMAKCPEPSLVTRLADKGRTWGTGPILFAQRMVQSPSGPCKEMLGFLAFLFSLYWALSLWFDNRIFFLYVWCLMVGSTFDLQTKGRLDRYCCCQPAEHAKNSYAVWSISRTEEHKSQGRHDAQSEREGWVRCISKVLDFS